MTNPTKTRRRFKAQQRQEAVELCLSEGLSCTAVAQRLGLPVSSLAKFEAGPYRSRRGCARKTVSSGGRRIFSGWQQCTLQKSSCRREVSPDRGPLRPLLHGLALPAAGRGPQRLLRLAATATPPPRCRRYLIDTAVFEIQIAPPDRGDMLIDPRQSAQNQVEIKSREFAVGAPFQASECDTAA